MKFARRNIAAAAAAVFAALAAQPVIAQDEGSDGSQADQPKLSYVGVLGSYLDLDKQRVPTDGTGIGLLYGRQFGHGNWFWEAQLFTQNLETNKNDVPDHYRSGGGLDLVYALNERRTFTPFALLGIGGNYNDGIPDDDDKFDFFANAGARNRALRPGKESAPENGAVTHTPAQHVHRAARRCRGGKVTGSVAHDSPDGVAVFFTGEVPEGGDLTVKPRGRILGVDPVAFPFEFGHRANEFAASPLGDDVVRHKSEPPRERRRSLADQHQMRRFHHAGRDEHWISYAFDAPNRTEARVARHHRRIHLRRHAVEAQVRTRPGVEPLIVLE